ncbi:hypothetical protein JCM19237_5256 [Photobacterium aphoticum]|uniref:Uncharacterized protein n=1 Tax=Photobacterium aphoticum TaxID=754436 RepID=A0A090QJC6_9GAMM|nr:hypothetical protein JCM19237_5256 [Photobacterium aphoticum]
MTGGFTVFGFGSGLGSGLGVGLGFGTAFTTFLGAGCLTSGLTGFGAGG